VPDTFHRQRETHAYEGELVPLAASRVLVLPAALALALTSGAASASPPDRTTGPASNSSAAPLTFALIGDTPYGEEQRVVFPELVADIDADPKVRFVLHAGDVKGGSQTCDDSRFLDLAELYGTFDDPFVLTPGDNDWTDCHRPNNGSYLPTERLDRVREIFYPDPHRTTGERRLHVDTQADDPQHSAYVENTVFERSRVVFAAVHVVGSRNGLAPWSGLPGGDQPEVRLAEVAAREAAALAWIDEAFDRAQAGEAEGVLLLLQAEPVAGDEAFAAVRERIVSRAAGFDGQVLLVHGDEHRYEAEPAYAAVPSLTRLETFGDTATDWLRVTVDPRTEQLFSWETQVVGP
jgi:hypothetical protein